MPLEKKDIRALQLGELTQFFEQNGEKPFRAKQVFIWLWGKSCDDFDKMTDLSITARSLLKKYFCINPIRVNGVFHSHDGTIKSDIRLYDGFSVESVLIPTEKRITACISSQVGCSLDCKFCATARIERVRNLGIGEIYDQIVAIREQSRHFYRAPLTNIVFMGMGEPLLNYANVISAIDKITSPQGLNVAARRITVSTVGVAKMIIKMADDGVKFNLAVSLHAALDKTRSAIMPFNNFNTLEDLANALRYWYAKLRRKVTYEHIVWKGVNDNQEHVDALLQFCKVIPSKVNLIEYNPIRGGSFVKATDEAMHHYQRSLENQGITARIRKSRGKDIDAACGQLANTCRREESPSGSSVMG